MHHFFYFWQLCIDMIIITPFYSWRNWTLRRSSHLPSEQGVELRFELSLTLSFAAIWEANLPPQGKSIHGTDVRSVVRMAVLYQQAFGLAAPPSHPPTFSPRDSEPYPSLSHPHYPPPHTHLTANPSLHFLFYFIYKPVQERLCGGEKCIDKEEWLGAERKMCFQCGVKEEGSHDSLRMIVGCCVPRPYTGNPFPFSWSSRVAGSIRGIFHVMFKVNKNQVVLDGLVLWMSSGTWLAFNKVCLLKNEYMNGVEYW